MAEYFVMECLSPLKAEHWVVKVSPVGRKVRWTEGHLLSPEDQFPGFRPPAGMIDVSTPEDLEVPPRVYAEIIWMPIPLMTRRLVDALRASGVDNLQTYDTRLVEPRGPNPPPENHYLAVNLVGLVAAADLQKSKLNPEVKERLISVDFHSLAVDKAKARDQLLFRLAENTSVILAHERVRESVEKAGINSLT